MEKIYFSDVVKLLVRRKWILLAVFLLSTLAGCILVWTLPNRYRSFTVILPAKTTQLDQLFQDEEFGYEVHAEWLMEILNSETMFDSVTTKFRLWEHYDIDTTSQTWRNKLLKEYRSSIWVNKSIRRSLSITVEDDDPEMAAAIANEIVVFLNAIRRHLLEPNRDSALAYYKTELEERKAELNRFELLHLGKTSANPSVPVLSGDGRFRVSSLEEERLFLEYQRVFTQYFDAKTRYETAVRKFENSIPSVYVLNKARPNYKKSFPRYSLMIPLTVIPVLLFALMVFVFTDMIRPRLKNSL